MDMPSIASIVSIGRFYMGVSHSFYNSCQKLQYVKYCTEETLSMFLLILQHIVPKPDDDL